MKYALLLIILLGFCLKLNAQKNPDFSIIDKIALQIPDSLTHSTQDIASYFNSKFSISTDKSRAIFIWLAKNIQYDIENMFAINFYQDTKIIIDNTLKNRKGI